MKVTPPTSNDAAGLRLGTIEGTREELHALRDAIDKLLLTSEGDTRRHTQAMQLSTDEGWMVRKAAES